VDSKEEILDANSKTVWWSEDEIEMLRMGIKLYNDSWDDV
jgi:hypothetical protein